MRDPRPLWKRLFIPDFKARSSRVRVIISTPVAIMLIISMVTEHPPVEQRLRAFLASVASR